MKLKKINKKKGVMSEIVSVFILLLVISVLAGLTFLFTAELKDQIQETATGGINSTSYKAVNSTETAGARVIDFLPLVFFTLIFGAILTLVLKIILPFLNLGQSVGGF